MKIAFDIDQVVCDIVPAARSLLASRLSIPVDTIIETFRYDQPFDHPDPEVAKLVQIGHDFWDDLELLETAPPIAGAAAATRRLHNLGLLGAFITRRPPHVAEITHRWLDRSCFPAVSVHHVGSTADGQRYANCKSNACLQDNVTHLVDDHTGEAKSASAAGIKVILIDAPNGRDARNTFLAANPTFLLAADAKDAVDLILQERMREAS